MYLVDAATQSTSPSFGEWVIGLALLGLMLWSYRDFKAREDRADGEFTDAVVEMYALDALMELSKRWDEGEPAVSMDDYWTSSPYGQRQRHLERVIARFLDFGARPYTPEGGSVLYKGSYNMRQRVALVLERQLNPQEPATEIKIGAGAFAQVGNGNAAAGVSTQVIKIEHLVEENREAIETLIGALAQLALATEVRPEQREEAAALRHELAVAQRLEPEAVPALGCRVRDLAKHVAETASSLAPLVNVMNSVLDLLQKAGLHV